MPDGVVADDVAVDVALLPITRRQYFVAALEEDTGENSVGRNNIVIVIVIEIEIEIEIMR